MKHTNLILFLKFSNLVSAIIIPITKVHDDVDLEIQNLLQEQPILDGHNDLPYIFRRCLQNTIYDGRYDWNTDLTQNPQPWMLNLAAGDNCTAHATLEGQRFVATDAVRAKKGGLGAQFWSVYVGCNTQYRDSVRQTMEQIDVAKRFTQNYPDQMVMCGDSVCVENAWQEGKFASLIGMEGGHSIDSSLAMIRTYYNLGARYMTLTHFCNTPWADFNEQGDVYSRKIDYIGGLTYFGEQVVQEMQKNGMLVDISHVSNEVMLDAMAVSKCPVIFSHSNARGVFNHSRNAEDEVLLKLKENDGIIMVNWYHGYITDNYPGSVNDVADHFQHIRELIGAEHIGMGADLDGLPYTVQGLEDVSSYPALFKNLRLRGWTLDELKMISSKNILRVMKACEAYAESVKNEDPSFWDETWIERQDLDRVNDEKLLPDSKYVAEWLRFF